METIMDFDDYEQLPTSNVTTHMMAGAFAGVMEHCIMYPVDSVKTRMQSLAAPAGNIHSIWGVLSRMVTQEGVLRPVRGMAAVVCGAGPAHALYFSCYEAMKHQLTHRNYNSHLSYGVAGGVATFFHDAIMTPVDVVKQRLQMYNSPYQNMLDCAKNLYQMEGTRAFYRSFSAQLLMNVPFQSIHFVMYEVCQGILNHDRSYNPAAHMISGALAGGTAAAITTPLDVCKTLLNTQQSRTVGLSHAVRTIYAYGGFTAFYRGMGARVLHIMPSTAICWSVYELFKYLLTRENEPVKSDTGPDKMVDRGGSDVYKTAGMFTPLGITTVHSSGSRVLE